jgi:hypothetical protein
MKEDSKMEIDEDQKTNQVHLGFGCQTNLSSNLRPQYSKRLH